MITGGSNSNLDRARLVPSAELFTFVSRCGAPMLPAELSTSLQNGTSTSALFGAAPNARSVERFRYRRMGEPESFFMMYRRSQRSHKSQLRLLRLQLRPRAEPSQTRHSEHEVKHR